MYMMQHHCVKNEGKQEYCICLACICRKTSVLDKLEVLAVSKSGYRVQYQDWEGDFSLYTFL